MRNIIIRFNIQHVESVMKKFIAIFTAALSLVGCNHVPLEGMPRLSNVAAKDSTLMAPSIQFQDTPQSRSVIVGSQVYAMTNSCQLIKRYRVVTNSDFTGSLNLMKYRSALMGAKWITIVSHRELDRFENSWLTNNDEVIFRDGVDIGSARYITSLVADLYDCPCNTTSCTGR